MATHQPPPSSHEAETTPSPLSARPSAAEALSRLVSEDHPTKVGAYRIIRVLGSGGMGVVYLAQREEAKFSQRVALKIIKRGMDSEDILRRFEQERKVLAGLSHPNIARLIDGGTTDDGRPYFALEYVDGQPLDKYCDSKKLTTRQRLELFRRICDAVQYAHQNLIVHRDLKPGNVLITPDGQPKLLDFGIAKLLNPELMEVIAVTGPAMRLMTPEYASPEQVRGETIGTTSDIYSLGVMLYELLTGRRPYRFKTRLQNEIQRIVCEEVPAKPSTVISRADEEPVGDGKTKTVDPVTVALTRDGDLDRLRKRLRGDIDDIVLKALEKQPQRRYASALQLSEDIDRHLSGEPILARPPSFGYHVSKFVSRNRGPVAASILLVLSLTAGLVGTGTMWARSERAFVVAQAAQREEAQQRVAAEAARDQEAAARAEADQQRQRAEEARALAWRFSNQYLDSIHTAAAKLAGGIEVREMLVDSAYGVLDKLSKDPQSGQQVTLDLSAAFERLGQIRADIRGGSKGDIEKALEYQRRALTLRQQLAEKQDVPRPVLIALASSFLRVADLLYTARDLTGAEESYNSGLRVLEPLDGEAKEQIDARVRIVGAQAKLGDIRRTQGRLRDARGHYERADQLRRAVVVVNPALQARRNVTVGQIDLGILLRELGERAAARELFAAVVDERRKLLAESEGRDFRSERDLAVVLMESSLAATQTADHASALRDAAESRQIMSRLTAKEKEQPDARNLQTLAETNIAVGRATLASGGAQGADIADAAGRSFAAAIDVLTALSASDPNNADNTDLLADALIGSARSSIAGARPADALNDLERARDIITLRIQQSPEDLISARRAALVGRLIGDIARTLAGQADPADRARLQAEADAAYRWALEAARRVAATELPPLDPAASPAELERVMKQS